MLEMITIGSSIHQILPYGNYVLCSRDTKETPAHGLWLLDSHNSFERDIQYAKRYLQESVNIARRDKKSNVLFKSDY